MISAYTLKLGLTTRKSSVRVQDIDSNALEIYNMVTARFLLQDSLEKFRLFEETFLLVNTSIEIILGISLLSFNNIDGLFSDEKLTWRFYTIAETQTRTG